jgi:hypothetical protein
MTPSAYSAAPISSTPSAPSAVPRRGLEALAVGLSHFERTVNDELESVRASGTKVKAVRGECTRMLAMR